MSGRVNLELKAADVARLIVEDCIKHDNPISNLQLQKILYFVQRDWMKNHDDRPLFGDDFIAWQYGPVIRSVYNVYSVFGGQKITGLQEADYYSHLYSRDEGNSGRIPPEMAQEILELADRYCRMEPWDLVAMSHQPEGAWSQVYNNDLGYGRIIEKELIAADKAA